MTTSNGTDAISSALQGLNQLQGQGVSNPEVLAALQQIATAVKQVQTVISAGNLNGNLSPNVNNVSGNPITSTSIGSATANLASPASDDVINSVHLGVNGCTSNISPITQSPVTVINISNCTFNSTVAETAFTRAKLNHQGFDASVDVNNDVSNDIVTTWIPFIEQLKNVGFSGAQVVALLKQYNGDRSLVLQKLYEQ